MTSLPASMCTAISSQTRSCFFARITPPSSSIAFSSASSSNWKPCAVVPERTHSVSVSSIGFSIVNGTTGSEPRLLRSSASVSSAFFALAQSTMIRSLTVSIHIIVWLKRLKARGSNECNTSSFSESFSVFLSLRPCSASSLTIFASSACLITGDGRIFSSLRAQIIIWPLAVCVNASLCDPIGGTQPIFAISWLPQGVNVIDASCFSISSARKETSRLRR